MNIISIILIIFVALEFFYIMYLETIATTSKKTSETFNISVDKLKDKNIKVLLKNQGVYNGSLALLFMVAFQAILVSFSNKVRCQYWHSFQCFGKYWCFGVWRFSLGLRV